MAEPITKELIQKYNLLMCEADWRLSPSGDTPMWFRDERNTEDVSFRLNNGFGFNSNYAKYHEDYNWLMPLWFDLTVKVPIVVGGNWLFQITDQGVSFGNASSEICFEREIEDGYTPSILDIWHVCGKVAEYYILINRNKK